MKYFLILISFTFLIISTAFADSESRGAHCQPPSCLGARFPYNVCAGRWTCAIQHDRYDRPEMDPKFICIHYRRDNPNEICCKDGEEVPNCKRNKNGEMIFPDKESEPETETETEEKEQ